MEAAIQLDLAVAEDSGEHAFDTSAVAVIEEESSLAGQSIAT